MNQLLLNFRAGSLIVKTVSFMGVVIFGLFPFDYNNHWDFLLTASAFIAAGKYIIGFGMLPVGLFILWFVKEESEETKAENK